MFVFVVKNMLKYCSFLSFSLSVIRCGDIIRKELIRKVPLHFENNVINSGKERFKLHFLKATSLELNYFTLISSRLLMFCNIIFLKISQWSHENSYVGVSFSGLQETTKKTPTQLPSFKYCETFKNTFFIEHSVVDFTESLKSLASLEALNSFWRAADWLQYLLCLIESYSSATFFMLATGL